MATSMNVAVPEQHQCIIIALGNTESTIVRIDDHWDGSGPLSSLTLTQRAVWGARLRALADMIDPFDTEQIFSGVEFP